MTPVEYKYKDIKKVRTQRKVLTILRPILTNWLEKTILMEMYHLWQPVRQGLAGLGRVEKGSSSLTTPCKQDL